MKTYTEQIEELKSKIANDETGTVDVNSVDLTQWQQIGHKLAEEFEDYSTKAKRLEFLKQIDDLKKEAQKKVNAFNEYVTNLENNDMYTESARRTLYTDQRRKTENELKEIGARQVDLKNAIVNLTQDSAKKAFENLKGNATTGDLQPQDFNYITLMLDRDNSFEARQKLAEKYNYHFAVLDILNAGLSISLDGQQTVVKHPLENMQNGLSHTPIGLFDVILENGSFYLHEVLRNLHNKLFSDDYEDVDSGLF
ncbi:hypothetical protein [Streptococcus sp. S784/96/1]|uniref:hypothetical protein n=1 Tax=Streptococcus sp. S784/96/1 TaxID=2653499 RepID=UPI00138A28CE|nr:hypothetical protein [Streptococcus sp. S784/96/1]